MSVQGVRPLPWEQWRVKGLVKFESEKDHKQLWGQPSGGAVVQVRADGGLPGQGHWGGGWGADSSGLRAD